MRLIKRETENKLLIMAIFIGAIFGSVVYISNTKYDFILFYVFAIVFPVSLIWLKMQSFYYRNIAYGAPNVSVTEENLNVIINILKKNNFKNVADLGSGYGNICLKAAEEGIKITGYEINPFVYAVSKFRLLLNIKAKEFTPKIELKNIWETNLNAHDCVIIYGISYVMRDLEEKIKRELAKDSTVISIYFELPNTKYLYKEKEVYVYKI